MSQTANFLPMTIVFLYLSFCSNPLISQATTEKVDIHWGPVLEGTQYSTLNDIVGYDETGIYAVKRQIRNRLKDLERPASVILEHYDTNLTVIRSVELQLQEDSKRTNYERILHSNNQLFLFSSFPNQKTKENILFVQTINKKTLELSSDKRRIATIGYFGESRKNAGEYYFELSRDRSKLLVYYALPYEAGENERFGFQMFDAELNKLWGKEVSLPYKDELFEVEDYEVDNAGNVYLLGLVYNEKRKSKRKGDPNYQYQILSYNDEQDSPEIYPISILEKFLTDMQIGINKDGDIICAGFYSAEGTTSIRGSYFLKIDGNSKAIVSKSFEDFDINFITQNMTEKKERIARQKEKSSGNVELAKYVLDDIILREDGGAVLIGEQFFVKTSTVYNNNFYNTNYHYNYNDIIVINIGSDGQVEWTEKIPKRQASINDFGVYSSYVLSVIGDKLYFVFNDNPNNLFYKDSGKVQNFSRGKEWLVVLVELDRTGQQTREALFSGSGRRQETITRPKVCQQVSTNELVLFCQWKKRQQFARVVFK